MKRLPTVLHVMQAAGIAGAERHLLTMLPRLQTLGWNVRFWGFTASAGGSPFVSALEEAGIPVTLMRFARLRSPKIASALRSELRRVKPQILHSHLFYADVQSQLARIGTGIRSVRTVHSARPALGVGLPRLMFTVAGLLAHRTIAVSEHVADMTRRLHLSPAARIRLIPHGIDAALWTALPLARAASRSEFRVGSDDIVVSCTSRLVAGKGQDALIRAFAIARRTQPRLFLILAGGGPEATRLRALGAELLPAESYRFTEFLKDVRPLLWASDVFVFPTGKELGEAFGLAALEAMASGLPVVASDLPPLRELVVPRETGILTKPGDVEDLAASLLELASDVESRAQMSTAGAERARARFGVDQMVHATAELYEELLRP